MIKTFPEFRNDIVTRVERGEKVSVDFKEPLLRDFLGWLDRATDIVGWLVDMRNGDDQSFEFSKLDAYRVPGENGWRND